MYTITSATNRIGSDTEKVTNAYLQLFENKGVHAEVFTLIGLNVLERNPELTGIENEVLIPTQKFIFIMPEYNGTFPGVLKAMIDITAVKKVWWWKKVLLPGLSTPRAGNLRGMDQITGSLHHLNVFVHPNKLPISVIDKLMDRDGIITSKITIAAINIQLEQFINF